MDDELKNLGIFQVNPNIDIQVMSYSGEEYFGDNRLFIQPGCALVRVVDRDLINRETFFIIAGRDRSPGLTLPDDISPEVVIDLSKPEDRKKLVVDLRTREYWEKCEQQREFFDVFEGEAMFQLVFQDCQKIYERVLREHPDWLK